MGLQQPAPQPENHILTFGDFKQSVDYVIERLKAPEASNPIVIIQTASGEVPASVMSPEIPVAPKLHTRAREFMQQIRSADHNAMVVVIEDGYDEFDIWKGYASHCRVNVSGLLISYDYISKLLSTPEFANTARKANGDPLTDEEKIERAKLVVEKIVDDIMNNISLAVESTNKLSQGDSGQEGMNLSEAIQHMVFLVDFNIATFTSVDGSMIALALRNRIQRIYAEAN